MLNREQGFEVSDTTKLSKRFLAGLIKMKNKILPAL